MASRQALQRKAMADAVAAHFDIKEVAVQQPGLGGRPRNPPAVAQAEAKAKAEAQAHAKAAPMKEFRCLTCPDFTVRDISNGRALQHLFLVTDGSVRLCTNPQLTAKEYNCLLDAGVNKVRGYPERLAAHAQLGRLTATQPRLHAGGDDPAMNVSDLKALQKAQVLAALARGQFAHHPELDEDYTNFWP